MNDNDNKRMLPQTDLDLQLMTTDSVWGRDEVTPELRAKLNQFYRSKDSKGKESIEVQSRWGILGFYTRDMRLANLSDMNGELQYCQYYLDLSNDLLLVDMGESFIVALSRAANIMETSQSKRGFFRKLMNTFRHEQITSQLEPPKKRLFGTGKGGDQQ